MSISEAVDVVIGLAFVYLLLSLLCTAFNELLANLINSRGRNLKNTIERMLSEEGSEFKIQDFYKDPSIRGLSVHALFAPIRGGELPTHIPSKRFADIVTRGLFQASEGVKSVDQLLEALGKIYPKNQAAHKDVDGEGDVRRRLRRLAVQSQGNINVLKKSLADWYDETMDVATDWYRARVRYVLFGIGFLLAAALNADTIAIAKKLSTDPKARKAIVEQAILFNEEIVKARGLPHVDVGDTNVVKLDAIHELLDDQVKEAGTVLGMGWQDGPDGWQLLLSIGGWILTALAISLGSPFWFDTLNRVVKLRAAAAGRETKADDKLAAVG